MTDLNQITEAVIKGEEQEVVGLVQKALSAGNKPGDVLKSLIGGMDVVGERMQSGDMFIPEVLMSARSMSAAVDILKPLLGEEAVSAVGKVVIGTVKGDLHDIGKNLVKMMLESAGFEVTDLGVDVTPEKFVQAVQEKSADLVALSALLTTTMPMMKVTIDALIENGVREKVKVLVGGAPLTQKFAEAIGADGYAADAGSATQLAKGLMS